MKGTSVYKEELQQERRIVFSGNATEAINVFPTKVNVSVAASLASVGPDNMQVSIQSTLDLQVILKKWKSKMNKYTQ